MKPLCEVPDDPQEARAVLVALAQHGIPVQTTLPSFLGPGQYWVDDENYTDARELLKRVASSATARRSRREVENRGLLRRWSEPAAWLAGLTILAMLFVFLGLPMLAALGVR